MTQQKKGPAEAATSVQAGSLNPTKDHEMNKPSDTTAADDAAMADETRDLGDACDLLARARHLNELMFMAGESVRDKNMRNAITTGADIINDLLIEVRDVITANMERGAA